MDWEVACGGPVVHNNNIDGENMEFIGVAIVWQGELPPSTQHQRQSSHVGFFSAKPIGPSATLGRGQQIRRIR